MSERPKLVLIDGHALLYRAYHALPATMVTSRGEPTNALYGFLSTVLKVLSEEQPDYVIVCMDRGRTFRHDLYPEYKAHRAKMPDDLRPQVDRAEEVLHALGIPTYGLEGYEADDLIGTLARQAEQAGLDTLIITGDSDALQLVREHVQVLVPGRKYSDTLRYDPDRVRERYGFDPERLAEFKALKGDPSDNIPGVPGIGEKTAEELVRNFGSLEALYEKLEQVPPRYRKALEENRDQAFLSRDLARIRTDVPVRLDLEGSRFGTYDREAVVRLFRELEFRSLLGRLPGRRAEAEPAQPSRQLPLFEAPPAPPEPAAPPAYRIVRDEAALREMLAALGSGPLALDTETTSLQPMDTELVGISLARGDGRAWYIPVGHRTPDGRRLPGQLPWEEVRRQLSPLLGDARIPKIAHHAKFDTLVLAEQGLEVRGVTFDTLIAAYLVGGRTGLVEGEGESEGGAAALRKDRSIGLKNLAFRYLGVEMRDIAEILGKGREVRTMDQVPIEVVGPYACADAEMTFRLKEVLESQLAENGLTALFEEVEMPLVEVLREMERTGVLLDIPFLHQMSGELQRALKELEEEIYGYAGHRFNVHSTQQLGEVLFRELGLPLTATSKLKSGGYSTASEVLEKLRAAHPIVEAVLRLRELAKLKSTYVDALPLLVNRRTGRVHTSFNQTATATGRLSSSNPNLQNIPIRTEIGRKVRQAFIADPGWVLLSADYSQVELRVLAHISRDEGLLSAFRRGEDIHASTASTVLGVPLAEVTPEMRRLAKCVAKGTLVYTSYGLQPIEALGERPEVGQFTPLGHLSVATDGAEKEATHLYFDGRRPVRTITVKTGLSIACTHRHRLRVIDREGNYVWKSAGEIERGDFLAVVKGSRVFGHNDILPQVEFPAALRRTRYKDLNIPSHWTPELARFLGYVLSGGYLYRHKGKPHTSTLTLSQSLAQERVTEDLVEVARALFGDRPRFSRRRGRLFVQVHSSKLLYWLSALGIHGKSEAKTIPDALLTAPYGIQVEFLRALFSGDGSLKNEGKAITYSTKSWQLASRLQQMLLNFGYLFSLSVEGRQGRQEPYYTLSLTGAGEVRRFLDEIGFISDHKRTSGEVAYACDRSVIPYQTERIGRLYPFLKGGVKEKAYEVLQIDHPVNLNRTRAEMVVRHLWAGGLEHPALTELENPVSKNLVFLPVIAIEEGEADVYDLFVPEGNAYVANGFVSHNTINFGIIYGMSGYGLAQRTGLSQEEADRFIKNYFARYPGVGRYVEGIKRKAHEQGYVETLLGRRRYIPELRSSNRNVRMAAEREAVNTPIQGTAADIIKIAMVRLFRALQERKLRSRMLLQVHDELVLEVPEEEVETVVPLVKEVMEGAYRLEAPLQVEIHTGPNWGALK